MRKFVWFFAAVSAALFTSCDKKGNSYDFAQILYPSGNGTVLYADQQRDTVNFATTYDWTLDSGAEWAHIAPESMSGNVPSGYYMVNKVWVDFDANTSDTLRVASVYFHADGKTLETRFGQLHYLNITRPERIQYQFRQTDKAAQRRDSIMFRTYADGWTLAFKGEEPSWMRLEENAVTTGLSGEYKVFYLLEPNTAEAERSAVLELKSRGVTTEIHIRQEGKEKEQDK